MKLSRKFNFHPHMETTRWYDVELLGTLLLHSPGVSRDQQEDETHLHLLTKRWNEAVQGNVKQHTAFPFSHFALPHSSTKTEGDGVRWY